MTHAEHHGLGALVSLHCDAGMRPEHVRAARLPRGRMTPPCCSCVLDSRPALRKRARAAVLADRTFVCATPCARSSASSSSSSSSSWSFALLAERGDLVRRLARTAAHARQAVRGFARRCSKAVP